MSKTLYIRNISEEIYQRLKERALQHRRSITQEANLIIEEALEKPEKESNFWNEIDTLKERVYRRHGSFGDSSLLIREDRDR